jgi:hypothetical protein
VISGKFTTRDLTEWGLSSLSDPQIVSQALGESDLPRRRPAGRALGDEVHKACRKRRTPGNEMEPATGVASYT